MFKYILIASLMMVSSVFAKSEKLQIDTIKSKINWSGKKFFFFPHNGTIQIEKGHVEIKDGNIISAQLTLDMTSIDVLDLKGDDKKDLEDHFKEKDFFDVEKYPKATFSATSFKKIKENLFEIQGELDMKGKKESITFRSKIDMQNYQADGKFKLNKNKWNIANTGGPGKIISKSIKINFNLSIKK